MDHELIELGAVYRWSHDGRLIRVLVHDGGVVMYDAWWDHLGSWGLADLGQVKRKRIHYYVTTARVLREKAAYVRAEPLSGEEIMLHRPDLPFSFAQCAAISWSAQVPRSAAEMAAQVKAAGCQDARAGATLGASEVCLSPFGPKGALKVSVRVQAGNGTAFAAEEILWKAAAAQAPHLGPEPAARGVGIYRLGLQRGIPGFYLWGSESKLHS